MIIRGFCLIFGIFTMASLFAEKVVVVGAGLAGLTAAHRLHEAGVDVHLYEARGRVGGRVFTVKVDGITAELGAMNIADGGKCENIYPLIAEFGLDLTETKITLEHAYFTGKGFISALECKTNRQFDPEKLKAQLHYLAQRSNNMQEVLKGLFQEDDPLYKIASVQLAAYEGATVDKLSPIYVETLYYMLNGGLAAAHQGEGQEEKQIRYDFLKEGNSLLPEKMAERLGDRLHLNHPLTKVAKDADGRFLLKFQNGEETKADILLLALPCSVYDQIDFEEKIIPTEKLASIQNVQYGTNAKLLIPFSKLPSKRIGLFNDRVVAFMNADRNLLTMYYTGETSRFTQDTILEIYTRDRPMLEMKFGDLCPPLAAPTIATDEALHTYEGPVAYSWPSDPYAKGTYSYIATGQEALLTALHNEHGESVKTLFAPIDHKLYFAGEHASILTDAPGTMEAACESGERAARMILSHLGQHSS